MRLRRVRTIAAFELRSTVMRLSFFVTSFGLPLLLGAITVTSAIVQTELVRTQASAPVAIGVVDLAGVLGAGPLTPPLTRLADEQTGLVELQRQRIDELCIIAPDWRVSGAVRFVTRDDAPVLTRDDTNPQRLLAASLRRAIAHDAVDPAVMERLVTPVAVVRERLTLDGVESESASAIVEALAAVAVPMILGILLMSSLLMASGYLVQTIAQDKETKIVEVLLASATADELMAGKLLGLGTAGLLQFAIWAVLGGGAAGAIAAAVPGAFGHPPREALLFLPLFFLLGYAFLGSLMLATGAFGSSAAESQKLVLGWVLLAIVPLLLLPVMLEDPHGTIARTMTFIPFCSPITLIVRLAVDGPGVPRWEIAAAAAELVAATYLSLFVGARLFRVGLLMTGGAPSLRSIIAQARSR